MAEANPLRIGQSIDIRRTDGRQHSAMISEVNLQNRSVTVEWFEKGETKGKEVDFETVFAINPDLAVATTSPSEVKSNGGPSTRTNAPPAKLSNLPQKKSISQARIGRSKVQPMDVTMQENDDLGPIVTRNNVVNNNNNVHHKDRETIALESKRKSTTVQEIERLKRNREERRAQQEEMRKQKETLKNIDPGNPHWEFYGMVSDYCETLDYRPLKASDPVYDQQISVCVRKRPLNKKELNRKEIDVVTVPIKNHVIVHQPQTKVDLTKYLENLKFRYDYALDDTGSNELVYRFTAQPLVKTVFDQGFATCFAYGQTGSGKTHTMGGDFNGKIQDCSKGIYALTSKDIFKYLQHKDYKKENLTVSCSFFEIYSGKVFDLLNNKMKLRVLEDGKKEVQVVGLRETHANNEHEVMELIKKGTEVRTSGQTGANNHSSRSHAVFQFVLRKRQSKKLFGKFSLIDLAGNERGADTMSSDRQTRMEGAEINKSLLALKECIRAMGRNNPHLPFRASKLTLILRDSFVGSNARTCMIAMISPGIQSVEHTLNTLRYADRVKELGADEGECKGERNNNENNGNAALYEGVPSDAETPYAPSRLDSVGGESDLALLQSRNEAELSGELYNLNLIQLQIQEAEDQVIEKHQHFIEAQEKSLKELKRLLKVTERVDYDVEEYGKYLQSLLGQISSGTKTLIEDVDVLLNQLQQEEQTAKAQNSRQSTKKYKA